MNAAVFQVVDVDSRSAQLVSNYASSALGRRFPMGGGAGRAVIGIGDQLRVTIFEAGADGLFSTTQSKQTKIDLVVQTDGRVTIPYVGAIKVSGLSLEQAREAVLKSLSNKAVEPDVIITSGDTPSRSVTVSGAVNKSGEVPIGLTGDHLTDAIAKAGGPTGQAYETYVTLVRGKRTGTELMKSIIENPSENVYVQPGDQVFVSHDPRTFTLLGSIKGNDRKQFGSTDLNLLEAVALGGGGDDAYADAKGYFVFRYEEPDVYQQLVGPQKFAELQAKGMRPNKDGNYPIVYRFDMSHPDSLLVGQTFPIKNRDVVYVARHLTVDFTKFLKIVGQPIATSYQAQRLLTD